MSTEPVSTEPVSTETEITAFAIIRQGLALTPEFKRVIWAMVGAGALLGVGRITVPILFQRIIDEGLLGEGGIDDTTLYRLAGITALVLIAVSLLSLVTGLVMIRTAEKAMARLRAVIVRRAVDLSMAEHADERQGDLVSRATGDLDVLTRFLDWGAYTWLVNGTIAVVAVATMFVYSWQLATVAVITLALMVPILRAIQRRQQVEFGNVRDRTG
ncbi:MAG: ABC transporter ATP-binding protein, partial [Actinomycetia bacterium]|nr:ABC transporter ATP-binding protein [Actinomycetes bacterium]